MPAGLSTELGELAKAGTRAHAKAKSSIGKPFTSTVPVVPAFEKRALSRPKSIMQVTTFSSSARHTVSTLSALQAAHTTPPGCCAVHGMVHKEWARMSLFTAQPSLAAPAEMQDSPCAVGS